MIQKVAQYLIFITLIKVETPNKQNNTLINFVVKEIHIKRNYLIKYRIKFTNQKISINLFKQQNLSIKN